MGTAAELGITDLEVNRLQRAVQRVGATRLGTALFSKVLDPLDRATHRLTKGKFTIASVLGAFPVAILHTVGAKTGQLRSNAVNVIPVGRDVALVASNYGSGTAPGWAHNLRANPSVSIAVERGMVEVVATEVEGEFYEAVFDAAIAIYPGYARYRTEGANRIPVFQLKLRSES